MYIHLGRDVIINNNDIIACFDIDKTTVSKTTRDFLKKAQNKDEIIHIDMNELPKSFIVTEQRGDSRVYLSNLTVQTIQRRNRLPY